MSASVDRPKVHTSHCCAVCGCKYLSPFCPVETGRLPAEYPCEFCTERAEELIATLEPIFQKLQASALYSSYRGVVGYVIKDIIAEINGNGRL